MSLFKKTWPMQAGDADDFGSYCMEKWICGKRLKASFKFLAVDYLRSYVGALDDRSAADIFIKCSHPLTEKSTEAIFKKLTYTSLDIRTFEGDEIFNHKDLTRIERAVLVLTYKWGFSLNEIGHVFDFSESRASQIVKGALGRVKGNGIRLR